MRSQHLFQVYRLFEVWGRNLWVAVVPALLDMATFGMILPSFVPHASNTSLIVASLGAGAGVSMLVKVTDNFPLDFRTTLFFALSSATSGLCAGMPWRSHSGFCPA